MDNALYVGLSRQMTLRRELDIAANNIANVDTAGFKVESLLTREEDGRPAVTAGAPGWVKFVLDDGVARNFTQGAIRETGGTLDLAIDGQGFFQIETPQGTRYTRDGRFTTSPEGVLTNQAGEAVLDAGGGQITVDPAKGPVTISAEGIVSQEGQQIGKVGVVRFEDLSQLEKTGDNQYRNVANTQPVPATDAQIKQGMLEGSNVNSISEITRLIDIQRAYESMAKMMEQTQELSRRSIQRMGQVS